VHHCIKIALDVIILVRLVRVIEKVLAQLKNTALKAGFTINESKTKYMKIMRNVMEDRSNLRVEGRVSEAVTNFKYLGSLITRKNEIGEEVKMRTAIGNLMLLWSKTSFQVQNSEQNS
jgi:hypothetical protein